MWARPMQRDCEEVAIFSFIPALNGSTIVGPLRDSGHLRQILLAFFPMNDVRTSDPSSERLRAARYVMVSAVPPWQSSQTERIPF